MARLFELFQPDRPLAVGFGKGGYGLSAVGASEGQGTGVEHEALRAEVRGNGVVLAQVAVVGVADDGVEDVFHVAAELVLAPCMRRQLRPRVARGRVAQCGLEGQLGSGDAAAGGLRVLYDGFGMRFGNFVGAVFERIVDDAV